MPMKRASNSPARSRARKKAVEPGETETSAAESTPALSAPSDSQNVDPLEGKVSVAAGVLFIIAALFPRSLKQLVMLSLGGGLLYRGMTGHCGVYQALNIDTKKTPLLPKF